jgi:hypothetical protein
MYSVAISSTGYGRPLSGRGLNAYGGVGQYALVVDGASAKERASPPPPPPPRLSIAAYRTKSCLVGDRTGGLPSSSLLVSGHDDDAYLPVRIPFPFAFDGVHWGNRANGGVAVSFNGYITFGGGLAASGAFSPPTPPTEDAVRVGCGQQLAAAVCPGAAGRQAQAAAGEV